MGKTYPPEVLERAARVKLLIIGVDGVLTDGRLIFGSYGDEIKHFNVNDGLGLYLLRKAGIKNVILTAKASRIITRRARSMRIDRVYHDYHYKINGLNAIRKRYRLMDEEMCFIGDDVIDIPVLKRVGLAVCPPNAMDVVKPFAHYITCKNGGYGAVREVCDLILHAQGLWGSVTADYFK